jgi:hypothetical protein
MGWRAVEKIAFERWCFETPTGQSFDYKRRAFASTFLRYLFTTLPKEWPEVSDVTEVAASAAFSAIIRAASPGAEGPPFANFRRRFPMTIGDL